MVASPDGAKGSLTIHQDARVYLSTLDIGESVSHEIQPGRHVWLQVLRGQVNASGIVMRTSDGLAVSEEPGISIVGEDKAEVMVFDLN